MKKAEAYIVTTDDAMAGVIFIGGEQTTVASLYTAESEISQRQLLFKLSEEFINRLPEDTDEVVFYGTHGFFSDNFKLNKRFFQLLTQRNLKATFRRRRIVRTVNDQLTDLMDDARRRESSIIAEL